WLWPGPISRLETSRANLKCCASSCMRYQRKGRYRVAKLIAEYGRRANMMKWKEQLNDVTRTGCTRGAISSVPICQRRGDVAKEPIERAAAAREPRRHHGGRDRAASRHFTFVCGDLDRLHSCNSLNSAEPTQINKELG